MSATGLTAAPEYNVLYVSTTRKWADRVDGVTQYAEIATVEARLYIERDVNAARELAAKFPKSTKVRQTILSNSNKDERWEDGVVSFRANLLADGVNGGCNETGIRRYRAFRKAAAKLGLRVQFVADAAYQATEAELETELAR
jgi:hypothetical protein